jgi:hypothetical protein
MTASLGAVEEDRRELVVALALGRVSTDEFVARFGIDPRTDRTYVARSLDAASHDRSADDLAVLLILVAHFGLSKTWAAVLASLLLADWHESHEDLANALQDLRDPTTVNALFDAAVRTYAYLDYDESRALAVKCIWALHDIGTNTARTRLESLSRSEVEVIRRSARERLDALGARRAGEPEATYRIARNARVHD